MRDLSSLIDDEKLSGFQSLVILLCAVIAMLDGFDTQSIAFVALPIATEWGLPIASFGPIFAIGLLGGLFGALGFGVLADRFGRKLTLVASVSAVGVGCLLTGWVQSPAQLSALRLLTGLGLGGAMPSIISITAEYAPRRLRATLVTAMFCGFPLGAVIGAIGATKLVPLYGWRSIFVIGGCLPVLMVPVLVVVMPESIRWLMAQKRTAEIVFVLRRLERADLWNGIASESDAAAPQKLHVAALFANGRGQGTALLWLTSFLSLLLVYLLVSWVPTIAAQTGRSPSVGMFAAAILNTTGIFGSILFGRLSDRIGPFGVVSAAYISGAGLVTAVSLTTPLNASIYWIAGLAGFFCIGAQLCIVAIASEYYPVQLRATGVGSTMGIGRLGAIIGPLVGTLLFGASNAPGLVFLVVSAASFLAGIAVFGMRTERSSRLTP